MALRLRALTEEETRMIKKWSHSQTEEARIVVRAKVIALASEGQSVPTIAEALKINKNSVRKWIKRFAQQGLEGLKDSPRGGRPCTYTSEINAQVIATALCNPLELQLPFASWTFERLTTYLHETYGVQMKKTRVFEILHDEGLRWRRQETWFGERVDPDFAKKKGPSTPYALPIQPPVPS